MIVAGLLLYAVLIVTMTNTNSDNFRLRMFDVKPSMQRVSAFDVGIIIAGSLFGLYRICLLLNELLLMIYTLNLMSPKYHSYVGYIDGYIDGYILRVLSFLFLVDIYIVLRSGYDVSL